MNATPEMVHRSTIKVFRSYDLWMRALDFRHKMNSLKGDEEQLRYRIIHLKEEIRELRAESVKLQDELNNLLIVYLKRLLWEVTTALIMTDVENCIDIIQITEGSEQRAD